MLAMRSVPLPSCCRSAFTSRRNKRSEMHPVDLIRKKRDGGELSEEEIRFLVQGAAEQSIPEPQLAAWLMAAFLRELSLKEVAALTAAMRYSGEVFDHTG